MTLGDMQPQSTNPSTTAAGTHEPRYNGAVASHPIFYTNTNTNTNTGTEQMLAPLETRRATLNLDKAIEHELKYGRKLDPTMDRKKLRRTVSNRLSAQRSRLRKAHYIDDMEKKVAQLEETIGVVRERLKRLKEEVALLTEQNEELERLLGIQINEAIHSQMMIEKNQAEVRRLKAEEKDLVKHLEGCWRSGPQFSSRSGLYDEDVKVPIKRGGGVGVAMNPFHNFDG